MQLIALSSRYTFPHRRCQNLSLTQVRGLSLPSFAQADYHCIHPKPSIIRFKRAKAINTHSLFLNVHLPQPHPHPHPSAPAAPQKTQLKPSNHHFFKQPSPHANMHSETFQPTPQRLTASHISDPVGTTSTHIPPRAYKRHHTIIREAFNVFFLICSLIAIGGGVYAATLRINTRTIVIGWVAVWLGTLAGGWILIHWVLACKRHRREKREIRNASMRMRMEGV